MSMYWDTTALAYHPRRKKGSKKPNQVKGNKLQHKGSHSSHTAEIQTNVLDMVTPHMHKDSTALQRSTNAKKLQ